eukprot:TRINITY_DN108028_c0_g1_i1.p1 TRINITY_DN108028_c0_g1~~TRINITY_DN108028_c0_g1_i1.p1  ORF type:complete len:101 (-),score=7.22 TRINITY_DN108028_c0_g1_i1:98-400(-)
MVGQQYGVVEVQPKLIQRIKDGQKTDDPTLMEIVNSMNNKPDFVSPTTHCITGTCFMSPTSKKSKMKSRGGTLHAPHHPPGEHKNVSKFENKILVGQHEK